MDEISKSAVLLSHLDPQSRMKVLDRIPPELRSAIEQRLSNLTEISQEDLAQIVREYQSELGAVESSRGANAAAASSPALRIDPGDSCTAETICRLLVNERPELLAAVCVHLHETLACDAFARLPPQWRNELVPLISRIGPVSPLVLDEIGRFLRERQQPPRTPHPGGLELLARLFADDPTGLDAVLHERLTENDRAHLAQMLGGRR